ncbi:MAG: hypothetical protein VB018_09260 [Lachnospiraceae bacterium]|nr:hypothetical protein [Lachnospiraceae bacterium]
MMYCKYCGSVLTMGSRFSPNCSNEVEEGYLKQVLNKNDVANFVGKNEAYFSWEFSNVTAGQKGSFKWAALWFGPIYCVYRNQHDILVGLIVCSNFVVLCCPSAIRKKLQ